MDPYFKSYEELDIHKLMLSDKVRTLAYKNAIFNCKDKIQDKIVMDVGAGTGILSIFCAQAGAKKVYAVEASDMVSVTKEVITENKFEDTIEIIHSKVEDIDSSTIHEVDIIVSEWMGFYLVHEGMLDSVLLARDRFLKENGILFPAVAKLYASPCQLPSMYEFWDDICGVNMKCVGQEYRRIKTMKPEVMTVNEDDLLAEGKLLEWFNLDVATATQLTILGGQEYVSVSKKDGKYQGICLWFAVEFPDGSELSTGPADEPTHWKQIAIVLPSAIKVVKDEPIAYKLALNKNPSNPRQYDIEMELLDAAEVEHYMPCNCYMTKCIVIRQFMDKQPAGTLTND